MLLLQYLFHVARYCPRLRTWGHHLQDRPFRRNIFLISINFFKLTIDKSKVLCYNPEQKQERELTCPERF
jgi:hypothetical protein